MKRKMILQKLLYVGAVGMSIFLLFFVICCSWIGYEVKSTCQKGQRAYGGDCVTSLINLLNDEHQGFRSRNDAIWVLGQMGDPRALPALQSHYTGNIPLREPLDKTISQYELKKAIVLARGGFNITSFFWKHGQQ
jgi:hypothetical protein